MVSVKEPLDKKNPSQILHIDEVASILGVSSATVRNWVKTKYLAPAGAEDKTLFKKYDVDKLKFAIDSGKVDKLEKRANKRKSKKTFVPEEYVDDESCLYSLDKILSIINNNNLDLEKSLFVLALSLIEKENLCPTITPNLFKNLSSEIPHSRIRHEIEDWHKAIGEFKNFEKYLPLTSLKLPNQDDALGLIYQSLIHEGDKSQKGAYYTPNTIVTNIIEDFACNDSKVLDPCCGSGQFLLTCSEYVGNPSNLYGFDIDGISVRLARFNLMLKHKNKHFTPNIYHQNFLLDVNEPTLFQKSDDRIQDFDLIATNPPWGLHFNREDIVQLKLLHPEIMSFESFSYFLKKSISLLKNNGILSFILPESILNVKTHKDIRKYILKNASLKSVLYLDRVFKNVFTPVIRLDIIKSKNSSRLCNIQKNDSTYTIEHDRLLNNGDYIFDIHANEIDTKILNKVYAIKHITLKGNADWALGIVTGNNKKHIVHTCQDGYEEIIKGRDIEKYCIKETDSYIKFMPKEFQQVAPEHKFRTQEKLVYRFISKNLIFAYDDKKRLTLNSANIVIPMIQEYSTKAIIGLFNSSLYQFIFQKKFASIKVLRSHIENLPLPLWKKSILNEISFYVDKILKKKEDCYEEMDDFIFKNYLLTKDEIKNIKSSI